MNVDPNCEENNSQDSDDPECKEQQIILEEENIGQYYEEYWQKPRGYYWGKLLKVFSDDADDDAQSGEFLQRKERSTDPSSIFYYWPAQEDIEIIDAGRYFWGQTQPDVVNIGRGKTLLMFEFDGRVMDILNIFKNILVQNTSWFRILFI